MALDKFLVNILIAFHVIILAREEEREKEKMTFNSFVTSSELVKVSRNSAKKSISTVYRACFNIDIE